MALRKSVESPGDQRSLWDLGRAVQPQLKKHAFYERRAAVNVRAAH